MSDPPPTRPKPGSLRDRIAAFENQAASQAAPPPPRPKPGGLQQWKPKQQQQQQQQQPTTNDPAAGTANPAPPAPPPSTTSATSTASASVTPSTPPRPTSSHGSTPGSGNSMSASDARESIKQGGSLKERMAALQGKAAFGGGGGGGSSGGSGGSAGGEPVVPKPKWKPTPPPPQVPADVKEEEEGKEEKTTSKTAEDGSGEELSSPSPPPPSSSPPPPSEAVDAEDEERQRRAAIAARMAKLGGARVGMMGAPLGMFAANKSPPPPPPVSRRQTLETVEPSPAAKEQEKRITGTLSETISTPSSSSSSHSKSPPLSMPVPAVPRRTGPPRRKPPKSPVASAPHTPIPDAQVLVGGAEVAAAETQELLKGAEPLTKEEKREVEVPPVEEIDTMESLVADATHEHEPQEVEQKEEEEGKETVYAHVEVEPESEHHQIVEEPADIAEPLRAEELENEQEEDDEEARRKRIADRLAKMGGVNPLFAPPPIPRRSSLRDEVAVPSSSPPQIPPLRRLSADSIGSVSIGVPARRSSVDSVKGVELGAVKDIESGIPEQDEQVEEEGGVREEHEGEEHVLDNGEEEEESNDVLATSMLLKTRSRHDVDEGEEDERDTAPPPPPPLRPTRGSSGFVTRPPLGDDEQDEQDEHEEEEAGGDSPPPLPVSPRFASFIPRAAASFSGQFDHGDSEEQDVFHEDSAKPVPVPHRSLSLRSSVLSTLSRYSQDEEEEKGVEEEDAEDAEGEGEEEEEDKEVRHVPPPPTRRVPLPPPPPPADEVEEQHIHAEPEQECDERNDEPLVIPPPTMERRHSKDDDSDAFEDLPLPHPISVKQSQTLTVTVERPSQSAEREIMDDEEGDPIDPLFHTPKRLSALLPHKDEYQEETREPDSNSSDLEAAKRETIAERMAKLGGIRFGVAQMPGLPVRPPLPAPAAQGGEEVKETGETKEEEERENEEVDEEEEERARKERIATKLAGMGGMRIGMMPTMGFPPRPAQRPQAPAVQVSASSRAPPARPPPIYQTSTSSHDGEWEHDSATTPSEDGVKVEMEESEMEEVHHEDAKLDEEESEHEDGEIVSPPVLPPLPRAFAPQRQSSLSSTPTPHPFQSVRPPVPSTTNLVKRSSLSGSTMASSIGRTSSSGSTGTTTVSYRPTVIKGQSDYVMVEEPQADSPIEEQISSPPLPPPSRPPPSPQRAATASHSAPLAPAISDSSNISQWELPSIPSGSLGFGLPMATGTSTDLESSWTDAMDEGMSKSIAPAPGTGSHFHRYPPTHAPPVPPPPAPPSHAGSHGPVPVPPPVDLSADDLMAIWGRVGVQVCETATTLYEKAKKALVGDGTYAGFVRGVLNEVPNAVKPADSRAAAQWGYVVYAQNGSVVQRRMTDILPGDVVEMVDARFKGHKGLQSYTLQVGAAAKEIFVGVVAEYEHKKSKLKVLQANQHVGQQTVESVTYRLEDLKSGTLKVYRVLEAQ